MQFVTIEEAQEKLRSNSVIVTSMAASEPQLFYENLHKVISRQTGVKLFCANPSRAFECFQNPAFGKYIEIIPMFLTSNMRHLQGQGYIHYIPQHLSEWSRSILTNHNVDIFWGSCSTPDDRGFVSLGPSCCYESEIIRNAKIKILECNENIPVTHGSTVVHVNEIDFLILSSHKLPILEKSVNDAVTDEIAKQISELVTDGSTLQLGIGSIPEAICKMLRTKNELGIHTEMIHNGMIDLYKSGNITNTKKSIWPGKMIGAFAQGNDELYQFINNNPGVELHPASLVNKPDIIAKNDNMLSINTAVEIDVTGQICSESVGHAELSGIGGAFETHVGAQLSKNGVGIIAITSTTKDKSKSKIQIELLPGAKVSIPRNNVDTIITEYGIAKLRGKTVAERAKSLIAIAHPKFRDELRYLAKIHKYI